ncbi:hypothetical protein MNAN1_003813 [Malassezia nana]|uniref:DFDF domain-containing protein n=1 Tax=Malassezia nana TaxID=180528 RepID=A0AAF0EPR8_9BASI|nr:hypothetical protein MNAN1_003813 [Malassezia nana]
MASFVGTTVQVRLRTGATFVGTIVQVDPATSTLKMRRQDTGETCQLRRDELVDVTKVAAAARPAAPVAPNASSKPAKPKSESPKAASEESANTEGRKRRNQRRKNDSRVASPALAAESRASPSQDFEGEFDFTKSTQNFDKKKIWEEIRVRTIHSPKNQEAPNPHLLVNINRNSNLPSSSSSQPVMLAPHEMVLDPSESAEEPEAPAPSTAPQDVSLGDTEALRASLAAAQDEIKRLRSQMALSEALTGLHIEDAGNGTFLCGIFQNPHTSAAHWRHKHTGLSHPGHDGTLRFHMNAPATSDTEPISLRYMGPHRDASDAQVLERMPEHFQGGVNVKLENAPLFQQRLSHLFTAP